MALQTCYIMWSPAMVFFLSRTYSQSLCFPKSFSLPPVPKGLSLPLFSTTHLSLLRLKQGGVPSIPVSHLNIQQTFISSTTLAWSSPSFSPHFLHWTGLPFSVGGSYEEHNTLFLKKDWEGVNGEGKKPERGMKMNIYKILHWGEKSVSGSAKGKILLETEDKMQYNCINYF